MTRATGPDRPLTISFLDRLAEHSGPPGRADCPGGPARHTVRPEVLRSFLRRDLTWLFNTRPVRPTSPNDVDGAAMGDTLLTYGLSEVAPRGSRSGRDRELWRDAIAAAVHWFEPRLKRVSVTVDDAPGAAARFVVRGVIELGATAESVAFEVIVPPEPGAIEAKGVET
jgi:type VI secretion system lysozyme-like protein